MTRLPAVALAALLASPLVTAAAAQTKTLQGDTKTVTATVEAIDANTRTLTLKGPEGNYVDVEAGPDVKRFNEIKVGDRITARYYENVVLRLKQPGEKAVDSGAEGVTPGAGARPAGTVAAQRTITATITAIDPAVPSITFTGPHNWKYSSRVADKKALDKVKVGDTVDITWTAALLVSLDTPK
jgi:hypothetical protein